MADTNRPERTKGPKLEPHQIILRPLITEKGTHQSHAQQQRAYSFEVNPWATKDEIKAAVEELFGVHVKKVQHAESPGQAAAASLQDGQAAQLEEGHHHADRGQPAD